MTRLVLAFALGAGWSAAAWLSARVLFAAPVFARRNVRGVDVPVGVGILAIFGAVAADATLAFVDAVAGHQQAHALERAAWPPILVVAVGFALLGIVDDLAGDHGDKGFRGHLRALARGRLTTGSLKLVGGGLVALAAVGGVTTGVGRLLLGAAVVALAANAANLFDRAPGRAAKVSSVAALALAATASASERPLVIGVAAVVGGVAGLVVFDLREQLMLGDAGANPLGAVLGLGVVLTTGVAPQVVVLVGLVALNLAGERISFGAVIDRTGPLRALDRAGRRPL